MQKLSQKFLILLIGFLIFPNFVFGADDTNQLTNLTVTYRPGDTYDIYLNWDDSKIKNEIDGYAIQWSNRLDNIRNDKYAKLTSNISDKEIRVRPEKDEWYYFRVYTYKLNGRHKILSDGSKIIKWKRTSATKTEFVELDANDVVITVDDTSDNSESSSSFDFGIIRVMPLDTFADLKWSHQAKMASSDYDGFYITIAKKSDLTDIVKTFKTDRNNFMARVKGLTPETQYYARGAFYKTKNGQDIIFGTTGETKIKAFKTIKEIDRTVNNRITRNLRKLEKKAFFTVIIGEDEVVENDQTINSSEKDEKITTNTVSSTAKRIAEIKAKIRKLQEELRILEGKKKITHYKRSTKKINYRDLIRKRLAAKRAARK